MVERADHAHSERQKRDGCCGTKSGFKHSLERVSVSVELLCIERLCHREGCVSTTGRGRYAWQ